LDFRTSTSLQGEKKDCVGVGEVDCVGRHGFRMCVLVPRERKMNKACMATIGLVGGLVVTEIMNIVVWICCRMTFPHN
jgi:hypothetical protein